MVIATQNPYEQAGIFPLPESQLGRFMFKIHLEYETAEPSGPSSGFRTAASRRTCSAT